MAGENLLQIYVSNPITTNNPSDKMYFVRNDATDCAMLYSSFASQFAEPLPSSSANTVLWANSSNVRSFTSSPRISSIGIGTAAGATGEIINAGNQVRWGGTSFQASFIDYNLTANSTASTVFLLDGTHSTKNAGSAAYGFSYQVSYSVPSSMLTYDSINVNSSYLMANVVTTLSSLNMMPAFISGSANVASYYNIWAHATAGGGYTGVITTVCNGKFEVPLFGTNRIALQADNMLIGYTTGTPNGGGLSISGASSIGTLSAVAGSIFTLGGVTAGFLQPVLTTTQKNALSTLPEGLSVYDSTLHLPYFYNGSAWTTFNTSIAGTASQILVNGGTAAVAGAVTLSLPSNVIISDNTNASSLSLLLRNSNSGSSALTLFEIGNDTAPAKIVMFVNSSTRSTDGGFGNSTIRTATGTLNMGAGGVSFITINSSSCMGIGSLNTAINTLDIFGGLAVGSSYAGVITVPTNGVAIQGQSLFKTTTSTYGASVEIGGADRISFALVGTKTVTDGSSQIGMILNPTFAPTSSTTSISSLQIYTQVNPPTGVTIATAYGFQLQSGAMGGLGSVTKGINFIISQAGFGSTAYALSIQGGLILKTDSSSTTVSITTANYYMGITSTASPRTATLPSTVPDDGWQCIIKDESGGALINNITVDGNGHNINGSGTAVINTNYGFLRIISRNGQYWTN